LKTLYTIEPADLERTKDFYCDVLGLENGDRPPLDFPGYWLYSGGSATVQGPCDVAGQHCPSKTDVPDNAASQPRTRRESVRVSSSLQ
jgi:catechol 2,3-dioxygenase-like lactoylglutathione lyase family enzyme